MWAVAAIAWWGRECRCDAVITGVVGGSKPSCCNQCKAGLVHVSGGTYTITNQVFCAESLKLWCDLNRVPEGKYENTDDCESFFDCLSGNYCLQGTMRACPIGTYSQASAKQCTACSVNTFQSLRGQTSCSGCGGACSSGQYTYTPCTSTANIDCRDCSSCPAGTYVTRGCGSSSDRQCGACAAGVSYSTSVNAGGCMMYSSTCQPGWWMSVAPTATADRQCTQCSGSLTSTTNDAAACDVCIAGSYKSGSTCFTCRCSGETYVNCPQGSNRQTCTPCMGSLTAGYCAIGREPSLVCDGTQTQDTSCRDCPEGKEKLSAGVRDCSWCPQGKYKIGTNTNACVDCTDKNSHTYPSATVYTPWPLVTPSSETCPW